MRFLSSLCLLAALAAPAAAQSWYARGEFNAWGLDNPMTDQGGGHYTAQITGLFDNSPYMWKIADANWTGATTHPGSDSRVYTDAAGNINFHLYDQTTWDDGWLPNNTRRVGYDDHQQFDWEIVGSFNNWPGTFDPNYALTDVGNGLHRGTFTFDAGIYDFKFRGLVPQTPVPPANGAWDTSIGNHFGNTAGNNQIVVGTDGDEWIVELDLPNGRFRAYTEAAPPGQVGDYNRNGLVDAADYTVFRDNFGSTNVLPNDPDGGTIGAAQYQTWKAHFGQGTQLQWLARSPQFADQPMVDLGGGEYELNLTGLTAGSDYDFMIARSDLSATAPGSNMKVRADAAGEISLKFHELESANWGDGWSPDTAHRVGYEDHNQFDWEIVGQFNNWPGANDPAFALVDQGNGLHTGSFTFDTPGTYEFKFRQIAETNPWNTSIGPDFGNSAGNNTFTITNPGETWNFQLDLPNGRWRANLSAGAGAGAVPEPTSLVMLLVGLVGAAATAGRRR